MRALTVWQPWAWALSVGLKPIENRTWAPPPSAIGAPLAIHAAKRDVREDEGEEVHAIRNIIRRPEIAAAWGDRPWPILAGLPLGAVTAIGTLAGAVHESGRTIGAVTPERARELRASPWWVGPWAWVLTDVREVGPIACRGAQGIWMLPPELAVNPPPSSQAASRDPGPLPIAGIAADATATLADESPAKSAGTTPRDPEGER